MSPGRICYWVLAGILFLVPLAALAAWWTGAMAHAVTPYTVVAASVICWGCGAWLARLLVSGAAVPGAGSARQERGQREALALEVLMAQPLAQVKPARATLRLGEYAYGAIDGVLQAAEQSGKPPAGRGSKKVVFASATAAGGALPESPAMASGELVITDQRVIFTGDAKSFAIALDQMLAVTRYTNGFAFEDAGARYEVRSAAAELAAFGQSLYKITQR